MRHEGAEIRPYRTLDAWRGVASLWVVIYHVSEMMLHRYPVLRAQIVYRAGLLGYLGVQLFFVISGYCVINSACSALHRKDSLRRFLWARACRVYPPFWCAAVFAYTVFLTLQVSAKHGYVKHNLFADNFIPPSFLYHAANLTLTQIVFRQRFLLAVSWTLCYEVAFYLIIGLSMMTAKSTRNERTLLNALHVITICCMVILVCAPDRSFYPFDLWPQFGLGVIVWDVIRYPQRAVPKIALIAAGLLILAFCALYDGNIGYMKQPGRLTFLVCLLFAMMICLLYRHDQRLENLKIVKLLSSVGAYSYSLYLTHTLTMRVLNQLANVARLPQDGHYLLFVTVVVCCIGAGRLFYRFCEQPFLNKKKGRQPFMTHVHSFPPNTMRKVAILMPLAEQRGGGELMLLHLIQQGRDRGIEWLVIFLQDGPMVAQMQTLGVRTRIVLSGRLRQPHRLLRAVFQIASIVRQERIDLICSWMGQTHWYGSPAGVLAGVPAIFYHLDVPSRNRWLDRVSEALPGRGVLTLSERAYTAQTRLWPSRPSRLVYPGVELDRFDPGRLPCPEEARRRLGLPADGPLIGIVGRLQRWKGMHVLVEAMPQVLRVHPNAHCVIVGGKHDLEPDYPAYLQEQIAACGAHDRVILAGLQQNIPEWMQAMDVIVHASDNEPFGIVIIEAMALSKPVIAGDTGGPTEIITEGANGLLTPYGDAEALASAILRYLEDSAYAQRLGAAARARALNFSTQRYAENFITALREMVNAE